MPVLAKEPDCFPDDLLSDEPFPDDDGHVWKVLHTRPRSEKTIARKLRSLQICHYLPQYERLTRHQRREVRSYLPLFPGYLFIPASAEEHALAAVTNQIANILEVADQVAFKRELRSIATLILSGAEVAPESRLDVGDRAEIIAGPFKGREGTILRKGGRMRLLIKVDFLQQGASVEVETADIRWIP